MDFSFNEDQEMLRKTFRKFCDKELTYEYVRWMDENVDFPPEESHEAFGHLQRHGIDPIFLLAPTTRDERVERVAKLARGYVYYVSLKGVTGVGNLDLSDIEKKIPQLRKHIGLPIGVGFGIRDAATAHAVSQLCDGVVVGSRIVQEIEKSDEQQAVANVTKLVKELRLAIDQN